MNNTQKIYQKIIDDCLELAPDDKNYIFRGTSCLSFHDEGNIQSTLYRQYKKNGLAGAKINFFNIESEKVSQARFWFAPNAKEIDLLTELRHYGDTLALIDFTRDINVALFFACQKRHDREDEPNKDEDGEIILLNTPELKHDIDYNAENIYAINATVDNISINRVLAQNSVFVHAKYGFIDNRNSQSIIQPIRIKKELKIDMLEYLRKNFDIDETSMYRDVFGFIKYSKHINPPSFYLGVRALELGDYKEAIAHFNTAINDNPKSSSSLSNRGLAKAKLNRFEEAIVDYTSAIEHNPRYEFAYINRGGVKLNIGDIGGALKDYNKALKINPKNIDTYLLRCSIYSYLKIFEQALDDANSALKINSESEAALNLRCLANIDLKRHDAAQADLDSYASLFPGEIQIHYLIGSSYIANNEFEKAIEEFKKILKNDPNNHQAHTQIGIAMNTMGEYRESKDKFNLVVDYLNSSKERDSVVLSEAYYRLGLAKIHCHDFMGGIDDLKKAITYIPSNTAILNHLGLVHYSVGAYHNLEGKINESMRFFEIAVEYYSSGIAIKPESSEILYNRGLAHVALGNFKDAECDFSEAEHLRKLDDKNITIT